MKATNKVVAGYCRLAHFDEMSMLLQTERLRLFAEEQGIGNLVFYTDNGQSGLTFDRPAFRAMEADMQSGKIRAVVALDEARIGRNFFHVFDWLDKSAVMGVRVISVNHPGNDVQAKIRQSLADAWNRDKEIKENF